MVHAEVLKELKNCSSFRPAKFVCIIQKIYMALLVLSPLTFNTSEKREVLIFLSI